jgi:SAM-dependent methyltransferase
MSDGDPRPGSDDDELRRVRRAYEARDTGTRNEGYSWSNPAYVAYAQRLERAILGALRSWPRGIAGADALDVGCGSGYLLHRLLDYGAASGSGIDLMEDRVAAARRRYPALDVRAGSADDLPFADASFDLVTQFTCLSAIFDDDLRERIAAEMWRVVRPGGAVLSYDMMPSPARRAVQALRRRRGAPDADAPTPTRPLGDEELARLFPGPVRFRATLAGSVGLGPLARVPGATALTALPPARTNLLILVERP